MHNIELLAIRDHKTNGMAVCLKPRVPYIITPSLVYEIRKLQNKIAEEYYAKPWEGVFYLLWYLHSDTTPWKGLDFNFIYEALRNHHEDKIEHYIEGIFELLFINYLGLGLPLINCSIINRKLSGISQDFFYLNRINFIRRHKELKCVSCNKQPFSKLDFNTETSKTSFPHKVYTRNNFYAFNYIDVPSMRKILSCYQYNPISTTQQHVLKLIFDRISQETLARIYRLASEKMDLIERFAAIQSIE